MQFFWKRVVARLIDDLIFFLSYVLISRGILANSTSEIIIRHLIMFALSVAYCVILQSSEKQATLGQMAMKIKVVDYNYGRLSIGKAAVRNFFKLIPLNIFPIFIQDILITNIAYYLIPVIMVIFTKKHQTLHDIIVNTNVFESENVYTDISRPRTNTDRWNL